MATISDVEEYLVSLLGKEACKKFLSELLVRWKPAGIPGDELITALVRPKQDELVLFAEKKQKPKGKEKKVLPSFSCSLPSS